MVRGNWEKLRKWTTRQKKATTQVHSKFSKMNPGGWTHQKSVYLCSAETLNPRPSNRENLPQNMDPYLGKFYQKLHKFKIFGENLIQVRKLDFLDEKWRKEIPRIS